MNCPNCGNDVKDEKAIYCPYCSKPLRIISRKKTGFPIAAGILTIFNACICSVIGVLFTGAYVWNSITLGFEGGEVFIAGFFGLLGFAWGLTSGIMSLRRKYFATSIAGLALLIVTGFVIIFGFAVRGYRTALSDGLVFGVPIIVLAILSLIFVAISKPEFS